MRQIVALFMVLVAFVGAASICAHSAVPDPDTTKRVTFASNRFYVALRRLVQRYYPDATSHRLRDTIHFEDDTRIFLIHGEERGGGEWRDPFAERGPMKSGIYCDIGYQKGAYAGMAGVPQEFDQHYFTTLLMAPYSEKLDSHLFVRLKHPKTGKISHDFVEEVTRLINEFDRYTEAIAD